MSTKWSSFKQTIVVLVCSFFAGQLSAQNLYDKRVERYQNFWTKLIPTYQKIQFAGSIGVVSIGAGWDYGKRDRWETELLFGLVPRFSSDRAKVTFTIKENFLPWTIQDHKKVSFTPLVCTLFINSVLDNHFWIKEPERYPSNYYKFSTRLRFHAGLGQRINVHLSKKFPNKSISLCYELTTSDLYLISCLPNKYIKLKDILSLSVGVKLAIL